MLIFILTASFMYWVVKFLFFSSNICSWILIGCLTIKQLGSINVAGNFKLQKSCEIKKKIKKWGMAINDITAGDLVTFIKWNDTTRDQTRNISHSELLKYVLFVKFANLQWMCLNWILLRKYQSLICFTWTSLQVYNKHKTQETVICS